jgi:hypothetical protein
MVDRLYAMFVERPLMLGYKKKYFFKSYELPENMNNSVKKIRNLYIELE